MRFVHAARFLPPLKTHSFVEPSIHIHRTHYGRVRVQTATTNGQCFRYLRRQHSHIRIHTHTQRAFV